MQSYIQYYVPECSYKYQVTQFYICIHITFTNYTKPYRLGFIINLYLQTKIIDRKKHNVYQCQVPLKLVLLPLFSSDPRRQAASSATEHRTPFQTWLPITMLELQYPSYQVNNLQKLSNRWHPQILSKVWT